MDQESIENNFSTWKGIYIDNIRKRYYYYSPDFTYKVILTILLLLFDIYIYMTSISISMR